MRGLTPKVDDVRNRDRQEPSSVIALTNLDFKSLFIIIRTVIPELKKYTEDNQANFYPIPINVCIGMFGTLRFLRERGNFIIFKC